MPVSELLKKIDAVAASAEHTNPQITIPYIVSALREIAKLIEELEKRSETAH